MAQYTIPAASSVVDFLNTQGKDSSFSARSKLYKEAGINARLGEFTGSANQNMALLDYLKKPAAAPAAAPGAASIVTTAKTTTPQMAAPKTSAFSIFDAKSPTPGPVDFGKININTPKQDESFSFAKVPGVGGPVDFSKLTVTPPEAPATSAAKAIGAMAPSTPAPSTQGTGPNAGGSAATSVTSDTIYPGATDGERDLVNEFLNSADGQALLDKKDRGEIDAIAANAEAKRLLEGKYATDVTQLENNLAKAGLAFSGIRNTQIKALADNLAASELNVDRQLASKLLESNASLRDGIMKGVEELVKAAKDKDKEAIQQLNAVGLAVVNGKLVPTLASRNADRAAAQQEIANARAQANFELSERRLQLSEQAAARAEARFQQLYGAGKQNGFAYARELFDLNPDATPAELRAALFENTDLSSTEIDSAMNLIGIPRALQSNVAVGFVKSNFNAPGLSRLLPGNQSAKALEAAKKKAVDGLMATGGVISINTGTAEKPKLVTYNVTSDQLSTLANLVNTVTLEDVKKK